MKLFYKVFLLIIIFTIFIFILASYLGYNYLNFLIKKNISENQFNQAQNIGLTIDRFLFERHSDILAVGTKLIFEQFLAGKELDPVFINNELGVAAIYSGPWDSLVLINLDGEKVASINSGEVGQKLKENTDIFKAFKASKAGTIYVSDFIFSEETGLPTMIFSAPVKNRQVDNQPIIGVIQGELNWPSVLDIIKESYTQSIIHLYTQNGILIGSNEKSLDLQALGKDFKDSVIFQHILNNGEKNIILMSEHNYKSLFSYTNLSGFLDYQGNNWKLIIETPAVVAFAPINQVILNLVIYVILFFIILSLAIFYIFNRSILQYIYTLTSTATELASGNLNKRVEIKSGDEFGVLANTFNQMAENLQTFNRKLEEKIKTRTKELSIALKNTKQSNFQLEQSKKVILNILDDVKEAQEITEREREKINTIIHSMGEAICVIDENYKIIIFNQIAADLSGYSIKEAIGQKYDKILNFISEDSGKKNNEFIIMTMKMGKISQITNRTVLVNKKGDHIAVADSVAPFKDKNDKIIGCVVVFRDATKERQIDQMKTEFVSIASHQLRTPLTGVKWFTELLLNSKLSKLTKKQTNYLQQIHISNERMIALVSDLLTVSHIETGRKFIIDKKEINLTEIIKQALMDNIVLISRNKVKIVPCKELDKEFKIFADGEKIGQIFHNLLSNAIKYSDKGGKIEILCDHKNKKEIIFSIKDYGLGIPNAQQKRVFEKFFRADNVVIKNSDGTGLGLYITKAIVEGHGGRIWFESEENKGTTFHFSIPQ